MNETIFDKKKKKVKPILLISYTFQLYIITYTRESHTLMVDILHLHIDERWLEGKKKGVNCHFFFFKIDFFVYFCNSFKIIHRLVQLNHHYCTLKSSLDFWTRGGGRKHQTIDGIENILT